MADISGVFRQRWRSGRHMGDARPTQVVRIRRGEFRRAYKHWGDGGGYGAGGVRAEMPGPGRTKPWQATWTPFDEWRELPNVYEVNLDQDFDKNGITSCTVHIDNVGYEEATGVGGVFHRILRGFLSPFRGYRSPFRPDLGISRNEWYQYLDGAVQLEVWQGYGDEQVCTFTGLTDQIDLTSAPDQVTITARDFGLLLADQHLLNKVKDPYLTRKPTVFADRKAATTVTYEGTAGPHDCSSSLTGHPPRLVTDNKKGTHWLSANKRTPNTEWVQIHIPKGTYTTVYLDPAYAGMECWISVFTRGIKGKGGRVKIDGDWHPHGWIDDHPGEIVPGTTGEADGGYPFVKHFHSLPAEGRWHSLNHTIEVGDNTIVRVAFRKLREVRVKGETRYRAGVRELYVPKRVRKQDAKQNGWILVDDFSDIVKVVLRWAGFKEWEIESTGVRLPKDLQLTFHNGDTLMDIIKKVQEATNYVFFMGEPSGGEDEYSIGVPIFRTANVLGFYDLGREEIRDDQLLTGIQVKQDLTILPHIIYIRGKEKGVAKKGHFQRGVTGQFLGESQTSRIQIYYVPPWSRRNAEGDVLRHFVATYNSLGSKKGLEVAARYVALNAALQSLTAIIEIPGNPGITVDSIVGVRDTGTGMNTRLYVASRSSVFRAGKESSWKMTLGGSLIDVPDVQEVALDLYNVLTAKEEKGAKPHISTAVAIDTGTPVTANGQRGGRPSRRRPTRRRDH
jgi:hypothetical protein